MNTDELRAQLGELKLTAAQLEEVVALFELSRKADTVMRTDPGNPLAKVEVPADAAFDNPFARAAIVASLISRDLD